MALADLRKLSEQVQKNFKNAIVKADTNTLIHKIAFDSPQLTYMFGGFSYDRIHQTFGPESSGKSSLYSYIAGQLQKHMPEEIERVAKNMEENGYDFRGMDAKAFRKQFADKQMVIYMDFERTFDPNHASQIGLNLDEDHFILLQPDTLEDGAKIALDYMKTGSICCVILDSDAMATTNLDLESDPGDTGFGGAKGANVLKQVYKNFNLHCSNYLTPLLVVSQERANMNMMSHLPSVTGGTAIRFAASTRNRISKLDTLKVGTEDAGIQIRVRNYKNKTGTPWRDAIMNLYFDQGFNSDDEYFDFIINFGFIHKSGGWFDATDIGMPKIQGGEKVKAWLQSNPEIYSDLKKRVTEKLLVKNELDEGNVAIADENSETVDSNEALSGAAALAKKAAEEESDEE